MIKSLAQLFLISALDLQECLTSRKGRVTRGKVSLVPKK
jgi:hypothetical protein